MNIGVQKNLNRQNTAINGNIIKGANHAGMKPKKSVVEDMEKMKQRREDRKKKNDEDKKNKHEMTPNHEGNGKVCDQDFENLIKKKKLSILTQPNQVK